MTTHYFKLLLAAICMLSFTGIKAQTYTSGNLTVVVVGLMNHDSTICSTNCTITYNVTVSSSVMGDSVQIIDTAAGSLVYTTTNTTGASPWTFSVVIYNSGYGDLNLMYSGGVALFPIAVMKVLCGADTIHAISSTFSMTVTNPCTYGQVDGIMYADNNNDCTYNTGDVMLTPSMVYGIEYLSGPIPSAGPGNSGWSPGSNYLMFFQESWMTHYTIDIPAYYSFIFPYSTCFAGPYSFTTLPQANVDFPVQATTLVDVECWAGSPANARPNRAFYMQPYVSNTGYDTVSGTLTFIKDSRVAYDASLSTNPAMAVSGDTLTWNYTDLTSISNGVYWNNFISQIHLTPNTTVNIGDTLCFRVYTGVPATDINPSNNDYTICIPVVNSYDPNIKEVSPAGTGVQGYIPASTPELTYTIHFQNTGTAAAIDVSVIDTLDGDVDASSLKIMGTSHTMLPEWLAPNVVKFKYSYINLADSFSNEPASHGFVRFSVKMHSGLTPGTQIKNKGYIYFDTNPAVITNEALNTIALPSAINTPVVTNNVKVYPNPATDNIFVEQLQGGKLYILSMNGSVIIDKDITNNKTEIDISRLPAGVYILRTVSNDNTKTTKFVKQ